MCGAELVTTGLVVAGGLFGLVIGSFLNVVAYRVPQGLSVVRPGSACPSCGTPIRGRDNIPVLSWVLLRGQCRDCGAAISARYPLVEAGTGVAFALVAALVGVAWVLPAYWWFAAVAITLVLTDLDTKRIPNRILFPGLVVGAVLLAAGSLLDGEPQALVRAAGGAAGYFALLFLVALAARGGFGMGDVKLGALLGLFLGYQSWGSVVVGAFAAFAIGGAVSAALLLTGRAGRKQSVPFGPAMVAGAAIALAWAEPLTDWYLGL
jgi:leader peptidase (prepilin peptidase)/N-methyltransferase